MGGGLGGGIEQKGLVDIDNSVIAGWGRWYKGTKWQWKNIIKIRILNCFYFSDYNRKNDVIREDK